MFAVVVTFKLKPGSAQAFNPIMIENAEASVRDEPGCHQFQVLHDQSDAETIVLYEVYADQAAVDHHMATSYMAAYREDTGGWVTDRKITKALLLN